MKKQECLNAGGKRVCFISNDGRLEFIGKVDHVINEPNNFGVSVKNPKCYFLNKKGVHVDKGVDLEKEYRWVIFTNHDKDENYQQPFPENSWFMDNDLLTRNSRLKDVKDAKIANYEPISAYDPDLYNYVAKHIKSDSFNNLSVRVEGINTAVDDDESANKRRGKTTIDDDNKTVISDKVDMRGRTVIDSPDDGTTGIPEKPMGKTVIEDDKPVKGETVIDEKDNYKGDTTI